MSSYNFYQILSNNYITIQANTPSCIVMTFSDYPSLVVERGVYLFLFPNCHCRLDLRVNIHNPIRDTFVYLEKLII